MLSFLPHSEKFLLALIAVVAKALYQPVYSLDVKDFSK